MLSVSHLHAAGYLNRFAHDLLLEVVLTRDRAWWLRRAEQYVMQRMHPWVDRIRSIGNEANHDLPQTPRTDADTAAKFTQQLLLMIYEYPAALADVSPLPEAGGEAGDGE